MAARGEQVRRSLTLWPEEWASLEILAAEFGTCPPSGPGAGKPSWRSFVKEIARGSVAVTRIRPPDPVAKEYGTMTCPICGKETSVVGGGVNHLRAHVRRGEAEEIEGPECRRFVRVEGRSEG